MVSSDKRELVSQKMGMHPVKEPISAKQIGHFTIHKMLTGWSEVIVHILEAGMSLL